MKRFALLIITIILFSFRLPAESNMLPYLDSARIAYTNNDFEASARLYIRIVEHGYESPQIYYNIGNCYYKQMQIPKAVLWYQRALKLDPSFDDAQYNLKMAQELIVDKIEIIAPPFYKRWYKNLFLMMPPNAWAYLTGGLFVLSILIMFLFFITFNYTLKKILIPSGIIALIFSIISLAVANSAYKFAIKRTIGVIMTPSVTVQSTPHTEGTKLFTIHEGLSVNISTYVDGWYEIRLDDGRLGWIQDKDIEEV